MLGDGVQGGLVGTAERPQPTCPQEYPSLEMSAGSHFCRPVATGQGWPRGLSPAGRSHAMDGLAQLDPARLAGQQPDPGKAGAGGAGVRGAGMAGGGLPGPRRPRSLEVMYTSSLSALV